MMLSPATLLLEEVPEDVIPTVKKDEWDKAGESTTVKIDAPPSKVVMWKTDSSGRQYACDSTGKRICHWNNRQVRPDHIGTKEWRDPRHNEAWRASILGQSVVPSRETMNVVAEDGTVDIPEATEEVPDGTVHRSQVKCRGSYAST